MTLSNFDWTDKQTMKWFILLPTGHEGPYSLEVLVKKNVSRQTRVWAEGLPAPLTLAQVISRAENPLPEEIPPLPPLPEEDDIPPLPDLPSEAPVEVESKPRKSTTVLFVSAASLIMFLLCLKQWVSSNEEFSFHRPSRMSPAAYARISSDFKFEGWRKPIFFKEYTASDMAHVWLVTSSFQHCEVEAHFTSLPDKLLMSEYEKVAFKSVGKLENHLVEFSKFDFIAGQKIIPGLYEMDLKATHCRWGTVPSKLANLFHPAESEYVTRMKVVLYHKGPAEFNLILDKLIRKKIDYEIKNQNQEDLFWMDLQEKMQTLQAISLQIEQHLLDFLDKDAKNFNKNLKPMVDRYTTIFGHSLTKFVVANEEYFNELEKSQLSNMNRKRGYEAMVRVTSKNIGFESMKIIEELQTMKKPSPANLKSMREKVIKKFKLIKDVINQKIIQLTEDRAN